MSESNEIYSNNISFRFHMYATLREKSRFKSHRFHQNILEFTRIHRDLRKLINKRNNGTPTFHSRKKKPIQNMAALVNSDEFTNY